MRPLKIKTINFLPFLGQRELDLTGVRQAIIHGLNEIGKSSFFIDTILFALQGQARKRPEGLINDQADTCTVEFTFEHRGKTYTVTRIATRDKPNVLKLHDGQNDLSERLLTNTQKRLDLILGFSPDLLLATAVSPQDEINSFCKMSPTDRERIFSEMLTLGIWEEKRKAINKRLLNLRDNDQAIADKVLAIDGDQKALIGVNEDVAINEHKLLELASEVDALEKQRPVFENALTKARAYEEQQRSLNSLMSQLFKTQTELDTLRDVRDPVVLNTQIDLLKREHASFDTLDTPEIKAIREEIIETTVLYEAAKKQKTEINTKLSALAQQEVQLKTHASQIPQTLIMQEVPCVKYPDINEACKLLAHARQARDKIAKFVIDNKWQTIEHGASIIEQAQLELREELKLYDEASANFPGQLAGLRNDISRIERDHTANHNLIGNKIATFELELSSCKRKEVLEKQCVDLKDQHTSLQLQLAGPELSITAAKAAYEQFDQKCTTLAKAYNTLEGVNQGLAAKVTLLKQQVAKGLESLVELRKSQEKIAVYRTLHSAYTEIPSLLFSEMMPQVEQYANEVISRVSPGKRLFLRPFKETKSDTIKRTLDIISTTATGMREFEELSGSAKFRQSLAIRIALSRVASELYGAPINLFIIDEGFGSLDTNNTQLVKHTLRRIAPLFDLFLVITHVDDLKDTFPTLISVNTNSITMHTQEVSSEVPIDD